MTTRARSRGPSSADWAKLAVAAALSAFVAWQVVKASAVDAMIRTNPFAAAVVAPNDPRVAMASAMLEFRASAGNIRPATREAAMAASHRAPLAAEPFFLAGLSALVDGDGAKAEALLTEARRRDPRFRFARLLLLDRYLRGGKIDEATAEISALGNLIPNANEVLLTELGRLAQQPATASGLEKALKRDPQMVATLLEHLARKNADPDLILRLARNTGAGRSGKDGGWESQLVASLVERGQVPRAYGLWRLFSAPAAPERKSGLYDAEQRGLPGFAPFNWYFPSTPGGAAERSSGALQVEFYGRDNAELAGQVLMLAPGRYRLSFVAEGSADGESSRIGWVLQCLGSKRELGEIAVRRVDSSPSRLAGDFVVPAENCGAQRLSLNGTAGEFTKPQSATIRSLQLTRAGS